METMSIIGIILALGFIFYGAMKSITPIILAPVAAVIVALTSGLNMSEAYATTYMTGLGNFVRNNYPIFLTGALFGKFMEISGLSYSISKGILNRFGAGRVMIAVSLASAGLAIVGISTFVAMFTLYPMCVVLFKEADVPRKIIPAAIISPAIISGVMPGLPHMYNGMVIRFFGVSAFAGPVIGFTMAGVHFVCVTIFLVWMAGKFKAQGLHFEALESDKKYFDPSAEDGSAPNPYLVVIPVIIILVLLNIVKLTVAESLTGGCVVLLCMFFKRFTSKFKALLDDAVRNSFTIVVTAAIVGFGTVVTVTPGYKNVVAMLTNASMGNPYVLTFIVVNIIAAITGSGNGGLSVALEAVGKQVLDMGANVNALARIFPASCLVFDTMPHNSIVVMSLNVCGVKHMEGYKYIFVTNCVCPLIAATVGIILASLGVA